MAKYYMDTGLWRVDPAEFGSDREAWEELRKSLPNKMITLYKDVPIVRINNPEVYLKQRFQAFRSQDCDNIRFIPIAIGMASHEWRFEEDNLEIKLLPVERYTPAGDGGYEKV